MQDHRRTIPCLLLVALAIPALVEGQVIGPQLQPFVDAHALAGAVVLVADRDRVLDLEAVGFADIARQRPMTTDALFWIASESKPITATALMMLVEAGRVRLDDPAAKFIPEFGDAWVATERDDRHMVLNRPRRPVTVRDLLSHTSGLPFTSPLETPTLDGLALRDAARSYALVPLLAEPGARYQYSNAGINTVGRIIEVASGQPYEAFLAARLLGPLGMTDTTFRPTGEQLRRLAKSYKPNSTRDGLEETTIGQLRYPLDDPTRQPMPAGGLFATAEDVAKFCRMILNDGVLDGKRYLSAASVAEMTRKQTGPDLKDGYGLGWSVIGTEAGHGGAYSTHLTINRDRGLILITMVQHAGFPKNGDQVLNTFRAAALARFGDAGRPQ